MRVLLIDDFRILPSADRTERNYEGGIKALQEENWDLLYLDHDLGPGQTGYDIMRWLEEHPQSLPKEIILITQNPVGRKMMQLVVDRLY